VLLAFFVFSGDPYTNGTPSRWANRDAPGLVYASWAATGLGAVGLRAEPPIETSLAGRGGVAHSHGADVSQVLAAASQNLN
jgi:hypothetical protein